MIIVKSLKMQIPQQKIIDLTNHFYLEMSKNVLTEKEYDIMQKTLIEHPKNRKEN